MAVKNVKSRKKDAYSQESFEKNLAAKQSLVDKVNNKPNNNRQSLASKVNSQENNESNEEAVYASLNSNKNNNNNNDNKEKSKKKKNRSNLFFFKLSKVGQIMFVIYLIGILIFGFWVVRSLVTKGEPILGSRDEPVNVISKEQVKEVQTALDDKINADNISVNYIAYRFVVVIDLEDSKTVADAKNVNSKAFNIIDGIIPMDKYFSSTDALNNDLFIYSTDVVPTDYDTSSSFILETYKNSKMKNKRTHDLLTARDKESQKEVLDTLKGNK